MRTRSSSNLVGETSTNSKRRNRRRSKQIVEPFSLEETSVDTMADQRTMAELLRAPTEGYVEAIVVPPIPAKHFELKHSLINLVTLKQFFGFEKEDPHAHIRSFNKITSTLKYKDVPESSIKLMLFPFSIDGQAQIWLDKEPSRSILIWDDLVSKFINYFFPPSKTTNLRNEILNFQQRFNESFYEAWDRFKDLLRACPQHGFTELHQLDTFYNGLNPSDQDSLNSAADCNLLERSAQDVLKIIENKSKVCNSRNKLIVSQVKASNVDSFGYGSAAAVSTIKEITGIVLKVIEEITTIREIRILSSSDSTYSSCHSVDWRNLRKTDEAVAAMRKFILITIANPENGGELKAITTRSGIVLDGPFRSNAPSITLIGGGLKIKDDIFDPEGDIVLIEKLLNLDSTKDLPPSPNGNPLSDSTTSSSPSPTTFEICDYYLEGVPFDSRKINQKFTKLLVVELIQWISSFLPHFLESDSVLYEDFSKVDTLTSTDNEDKVFNPGILIHENLYEVTNRVTPDKNVKKISSSNASLILEDYNPPLSDHELPFHIEIPGIVPDYEASRARGFVLRSLELQCLSYVMGIQYPIL
ncbi:reverse transcriptase domain-containing protein [Tanacetum coccineum]